jgi:hypothetical protein
MKTTKDHITQNLQRTVFKYKYLCVLQPFPIFGVLYHSSFLMSVETGRTLLTREAIKSKASIFTGQHKNFQYSSLQQVSS